ncbi:hypothetical protein HQ535_09780 [bacterium]|nr:hypothetical protein [bacterium]
MAIEIPFFDKWENSGHNDIAGEPFVHWDEDDPQVVPASCAKCHSTPGMQDFLGADGSAFGTVDADHPIGTTVQCTACHNDVTLELDSVVMPSGVEITGLGNEAICMQCHQGRSSGLTIEAAVEGLEDDVVSEDLGFINIHYFAAAASKYGTVANGGYEYPGQTYDAFFTHVEGYAVCQDCHDTHSLELKVDECATCHTGVATVEDLRDVRMPGSLVDYDGDGDLDEGVFYEIQGVQELTYQAIMAYAADVVGVPIVYDSHAYPYFFTDLNGDGEATPDEANYGNQYATWTPRLLKAAYNYQVSLKDPGNYAHGGKYHIQLLLDSAADLNSVLPTPVALEAANRLDHGHFAGSTEAFRHWDEDGAVSASCAKCHSAEGLPLELTQGVSIEQPLSNGLLCSTCHNDLSTWSRYESMGILFPSGATADLGEDQATSSNLCLNCHQGRSSGSAVDGLIGDTGDDELGEGLRFLNIHYFAAGATLFGTDVGGAYEYAGKTYVGQFAHVDTFNACTECHDSHALEVKVDGCAACHGGVASADDLATIRMSADDYDGDGDVTEGLAGEIMTIGDALYLAMQEYAAATDGVDGIVYDSHAYPYFFADLNGDGEATPDEANYGNQYGTWTPELLRAAYNYQYYQKDPGAFAHNGKYVLQVLYDSFEAVGGDTAGMTRP